MIAKAILHTDGGSRGNPGTSGIGFTLEESEASPGLGTGRLLCCGGAHIGVATNNQAEYRALIWGLENALACEVRSISVRADSELLVKQLNGVYRVKNEGIKTLFAQAKQLLAQFAQADVGHVYRNENSRADSLANEAMDKKALVGEYAVPWQPGGIFPAGEQPGARADSSAAPMPQQNLTRAVAPMPQQNLTRAARPAVAPYQEPGRKSQASSEQPGRAVSPKPPQSQGQPAAPTNAARMTDPPRNGASMGTYTLTVKDHFDAAHALHGYPGKCRDLHGHTWDVEVSVSGTKLDSVGIVYDFKDLKDLLKAVLDDYDHRYLNDVAPFDAMNATAENLARVVYERIEASLPEHVKLEEVAVWESPIARLGYKR